MNHYERTGLRVWWPALLVTNALSESNPHAAPVSWLITNRFYRFRLLGLRLPDQVVGWFLARIAARYGLILVARSQRDAAARAVALRRARRLLEGGEPRLVASTPEGEHGGHDLARPVPTSGKALAWLSHGAVPVVPVAVFEARGTLVARFGEPFVLSWPGHQAARREQDTLADRVMLAIAACLPEDLRGAYRDYAATPDEHDL